MHTLWLCLLLVLALWRSLSTACVNRVRLPAVYQRNDEEHFKGFYLLLGFIGLFFNTRCANILRLLAVTEAAKQSTSMASNYRGISKHNAMASNTNYS